ncbi:class I SAM-dependent methyltransferase [Roseibium litorale]|uniref:Class I SAM-dependent methyltransferase n=1 Tax=Roseibium litorale TaxID=2803841 RepID=A0ABR9CM66_9HYPH|nr:class I SAM-dependent methyltransferase [Roseibium litorale]MBD8891828.1 class I SAM-dependent methyltransferase [Roseibium litorale]
MAQDSNAADIFRFEWGIYRKITAADLFRHSEVSRLLERELTRRFPQPIRFLELACGDASLASTLLRRRPTESYRGIDLSSLALDLARANMANTGFDVCFEETDMLSALEGLREPADVIWCGLSLHHLTLAGKQSLFSAARNALKPGGIMGLYEPILPDQSERLSFMDKIAEDLRSAWGVLAPSEFDHMWRHIRQFDFPETLTGWKSLGLSAGFTDVLDLYHLASPMPCALLIYETPQPS